MGIVMTDLRRLVLRYRAGEVTLDDVIGYLNGVPFATKDGTGTTEAEDPVYFQGSWFEVDHLQNMGLLTMEEYETIYDAVFGRNPSDDELIAEGPREGETK